MWATPLVHTIETSPSRSSVNNSPSAKRTTHLSLLFPGHRPALTSPCLEVRWRVYHHTLSCIPRCYPDTSRTTALPVVSQQVPEGFTRHGEAPDAKDQGPWSHSCRGLHLNLSGSFTCLLPPGTWYRAPFKSMCAVMSQGTPEFRSAGHLSIWHI